MKTSPRACEHEVASIAIDDQGVLTFIYKDGAHVDLERARDVIRMATELAADDAPLPTIVVVSRVKGVTKGARDFFAKSPENRVLSTRVAMVIKSPIARIVANFFMGLNKPEHPTRLFTDEQSARSWLSS